MPIAAQNQGRRWVGIDRREDAAYYVALPASEGGSNETENRAPLGGLCHKRKSNTMTLTALRRDNRRADRWYGHPAIELRMAQQWALDYLAEQKAVFAMPSGDR